MYKLNILYEAYTNQNVFGKVYDIYHKKTRGIIAFLCVK